ncbi:MAG: 4Fe-4S dicluster domain-containing protein [Spirochaetia bacterium]|nr:4Fe-4S dicluster domain-containing protein [Spirochaetia bacterium]
MKSKYQEKKMWRSVESKDRAKYENKWDDKSQEFSGTVQELIDKGIGYKLDRKKFLGIMGASIGMAGLKCSREPVEKIMPYLVRAPEAQPGIAAYYATALTSSRGVVPVLVKTREGKPIKIDGHDDHPINQGAMTADAFSSIWDLYDPDRLKSSKIKKGDKHVDISTADAIIQANEVINGGQTIRILSRQSFSPADKSVINGFLRSKPQAKQIVYDFSGTMQSYVEAQRKSYGKSIIPQYRFDKAELILSIEGDFLGTWISPEVNTKRYSNLRSPDKKMNRLIVAESMMSLTGANADDRMPINSGTHVALALGLANLLLPFSVYAGNGAILAAVRDYTPEKTSEITGLNIDKIKGLADELKKYAGNSIVVGGGVSSRSEISGELEIVINLLNSILGNDGSTILSDVPAADLDSLAGNFELNNLIQEMNNGKVDVLILDRVNPVFDLPADSGVLEALSKVKNVISLSYFMDESTVKSNIVIALSHSFESWNDAYTTGVYTIAQPVLRTLFDTLSPGDAWLHLQGSNMSYYQFIKANSAPSYLSGNFAKLWDQTLADGYFVSRKTSGYSGARGFNANALAGVGKTQKDASGFTLSLYESIQIGDGQGGNNAFRHELPDPITKIVWENFVAVSTEDAKSNGWRMGDILSLKNGEKEVHIPLYVQPGIPKGSVAIAIGYGHDELGNIAKGLGVNALKLAKFSSTGTKYTGILVSVQKVKGGYELATTQRHHEMEGRALVRYAELKDYKKDKRAGNHEHKLEGKGLYPLQNYALETNSDVYKWGMTIDLSKCTGCSACVMSCYSENNIPVTGKSEVWRGREMSWLRIDRYYEGEPSNPSTHFAPVMCQHCENAPCENVCPVGATSHSSEGLNDMTYNRCVGTRYCSDNCPFKVRRFNWFENQYGKLKDPMQMSLNPDVTVRGRGVIEKCSFCVQRINEQRQMAKNDGHKINEDDLKTACQQGCPSNAITFGDLGDKTKTVAQLAATERSYRMLEEVNVKPRVNYLTRIMNKG